MGQTVAGQSMGAFSAHGFSSGLVRHGRPFTTWSSQSMGANSAHDCENVCFQCGFARFVRFHHLQAVMRSRAVEKTQPSGFSKGTGHDCLLCWLFSTKFIEKIHEKISFDNFLKISVRNEQLSFLDTLHWDFSLSCIEFSRCPRLRLLVATSFWELRNLVHHYRFT